MDQETLACLRQWATPDPGYYDSEAPRLQIHFVQAEAVNSMHPLAGEDCICLHDGRGGPLAVFPASRSDILHDVLNAVDTYGTDWLREALHGENLGLLPRRRGSPAASADPDITLADLDISI